jgi:uncharacterized protein YneF (UPF0154 family)
MSNLLVALFLISIVSLIIGLIKPRWILRWDSERLTKYGYRKTIGILFGMLIVLFFVLIGITLPERKVDNTATPSLTTEQQQKAEKLLGEKEVQRVVESKPKPKTIEITEVGCQRMLNDLLAVTENKPVETLNEYELTRLFVMRKSIDAGLAVKNAPQDLPAFVPPKSNCGTTLNNLVDVMIMGAKTPSYIIKE